MSHESAGACKTTSRLCHHLSHCLSPKLWATLADCMKQTCRNNADNNAKFKPLRSVPEETSLFATLKPRPANFGVTSSAHLP